MLDVKLSWLRYYLLLKASKFLCLWPITRFAIEPVNNRTIATIPELIITSADTMVAMNVEKGNKIYFLKFIVLWIKL
jgi:hypothetical protein